ncbi:hypothetical protein M885DRAFT_556383 [Pelagophyceae sp. CCMP2097]|nr:hypothetical protein M885DRAFT_556383 [Pelagophyceae sp. CCMP2097]
MDEPLKAATPKPCCVCAEQGGKHCTKCKSRHYCSTPHRLRPVVRFIVRLK